MNSELADFFQEQAGKPFQLGQSDCALWLADWVMRARQCDDPAYGYRGAYKNEIGWLRICGGEGLRGIISDIANMVGLQPTDDPLPGDIGVISFQNVKETGAIMGNRKGWVIRSANKMGAPGVARVIDAKILAAWRV